tara:strand:- start:4255 stop:5322 length:1068 start_codon:yes stop_codon:yes gene_type:complete
MRKWLLLILVGLIFTQEAEKKNNYFVDNFLKYSTFYASFSVTSPLKSANQFEFTGVDIQEVTQEIEYNFNYSIGIRKIARFKYELKSKKFYDGSESAGNESANIGAVKGWEYLFKYSNARAFGQEFVNTEAWLRYVGDKFSVKTGYSKFGLEDLTFSQIDGRYKKNFGKVNLTTGIAFRGTPVKEYPIGLSWIDEFDGQWWQLAYTQGWVDEFYCIDYYYGPCDYNWYNPEGELISETDSDFYNNYFDGIVNNYFESQIIDRGWQWEASLAIGVDYYHYSRDFWFHSWISIYPYSYGLTDFNNIDSREKELDHDLGAILGYKITKHVGAFIEGRHLSYFDLTAYDFKVGINYTFF